ncbi:MAG: hypothetical protein J7J19_01845 [Thaumarchaeota archaeon]|nr:hypothetical protein [Nitrososphaerota archaeon]
MVNWDEFLILNYLDIFRSSLQKDIENNIEIDKEKIREVLNDLLRKGFVRRVDDQWQIEHAGREEMKRLRREVLESSGRREEVLSYCKEFEELNTWFKDLVTRWQVKNEGGMLVPNDHSDPEYDLAIIRELGELHRKTVDVLEKLSKVLPILKTYITRLNRALNLVMRGEIEYLSGVDVQSYHNIWFELHEGLLRLSGLKRVE